MNAREALKEIGLEPMALLQRSVSDHYDEEFSIIETALTELERLQERDTAKKVIEIEDNDFNCPSCSQTVTLWLKFVATRRYCSIFRKYCPYCGQRLDWSE